MVSMYYQMVLNIVRALPTRNTQLVWALTLDSPGRRPVLVLITSWVTPHKLRNFVSMKTPTMDLTIPRFKSALSLAISPTRYRRLRLHPMDIFYPRQPQGYGVGSPLSV